MTVILSDDEDWDDDGDSDDYDERLMPPSRYEDDEYDDWYDNRDHWDHWEPDPEDAEYARWLEEEAEHQEKVHADGGVCNCKPPLRSRIAWWLKERKGRAASWLRNRRYDEPPF